MPNSPLFRLYPYFKQSTHSRIEDDCLQLRETFDDVKPLYIKDKKEQAKKTALISE